MFLYGVITSVCQMVEILQNQNSFQIIVKERQEMHCSSSSRRKIVLKHKM